MNHLNEAYARILCAWYDSGGHSVPDTYLGHVTQRRRQDFDLTRQIAHRLRYQRFTPDGIPTAQSYPAEGLGDPHGVG